jgi:hypothetical protein
MSPRVLHFADLLRRELAADRVLYLAMGLYAAVGVSYLALAERLSGNAYAIYLGKLFVLVVGTAPFMFIALIVVPAIWMSPQAPYTRLKSWLNARNAARLIAGLSIVVFHVLFLGTYTGLKTARNEGGFVYDVALANLDAGLHLGIDPGPWIHAAIDSAWLMWAAEVAYAIGWALWYNGYLLWIAISPGDPKRRIRYVLCYLASWTVVGTFVAAVFPSAGPCFYALVTGDAERFAGLVAVLQAESADGSGTAVFQNYLWRLYTENRMDFGTGISAFPSMHVALVALNAMFVFEKSRILGMVAWAFALFILFCSVYLGWHYAVDGYASIVIVGVIYAVGRRLTREEVAGWPEESPAPLAPVASRGEVAGS